MGKCSKHPDKEAFSICKGCGKEFCEKCLVEGADYYYCMNDECQKLLKNDFDKFETPEIIICPNCESELELTLEESTNGKTRCPECELPIDCRTKPPRILSEEKYTEILRSLNVGDIVLIKSMLEDAKIDYYSYGENFLNVRPLLEPVRIFVNDMQLDVVKELLQDFELKIFGFSNRQDVDFD